MFSVAPNYLSGVSVFLGDDVTRRDTDGELVVFIGPATKGTYETIRLNNVDEALSVYGSNNPLTKAIYEFWDGYSDAGKNINIKLVAKRIGGNTCSLTTSFGLSLETVGAWEGIENDYFIYVNAGPVVASRCVKIWDKNKLKVYDNTVGKAVDASHFVIPSFTLTTPVYGNTTGIFGKDLDQDPHASSLLTLAGLALADVTLPAVNAGVAPLPVANVALGAATISSSGNCSGFPSAGVLVLTASALSPAPEAKLAYSALSYNSGTGVYTFTLADGVTVPNAYFTTANGTKIGYIGSVSVAGDSGLNLTPREKYEAFRNALIDIEMYTPDYIVPAGVAYNESMSYTGSYTATTTLTEPLASDGTSAYVTVDGAEQWPSTGKVTIGTDLTKDVITYTAKAVYNVEDYRLTIKQPTFLCNAAASGATTLTLVGPQAGFTLSDLNSNGWFKIGSSVVKYKATLDATGTPTGVLTIVDPDNSAVAKAVGVVIAASGVVTKVAGPAFTGAVASTTYSTTIQCDAGVGYVKEVDAGDHYEFSEWSDTKKADYYAGHFGYLFANFCQNASVGYNTPLCGMNVDLSAVEAAGYTRASIVDWIGDEPEYIYSSDGLNIVGVGGNGTGLLGEVSRAGSTLFNRCGLSDPDNSFYADPAYGLLYTDQGYIDGDVIYDTYNKPVDLGKFMLVGAGILTFNNRASGNAYTDTCGIYALGMLAGTRKSEGISFAKIGTSSNVSVTVVVNRKLYNDLAKKGYVVVTRENGLGWVINNDNSCARGDSGYFLISTTRIIKTIIERKRAVLSGFIGKPLNRYYYEAANTKLAESFGKDVNDGLLNGYTFDLQIVQSQKAIGKLFLKTSLNPPLELTQVDIESVIDRNLTSTSAQ